VRGEYPPARRRSGRRTRGRRAVTDPDLADPDLADLGPDGYGPAEPASARLATEDGPGSAPVQPAWSDEWAAEDREQRREERERDRKQELDPESQARQICLRQLALAPKTRSQLYDALRKRDIPDDVADIVLSRFADVGLIDDAAFARAWVESRHYSKGLAGRALRDELRRRGVGDDDIKEAVATLGPDAEVETARRLVERKLASTKGQPTETRTRRLAGMLARKGYPAGLAFRIIREALEAEGVAGEEAEAALGDDPPGDWY
jgi:regulatory protein